MFEINFVRGYPGSKPVLNEIINTGVNSNANCPRYYMTKGHCSVRILFVKKNILTK